MRTLLTSLAILVVGTGLGACGNTSGSGAFDQGDDGGSGDGSGGGSSGGGSSGGGSSGSTSSGGGSSGSGSSSGGTGSSSGCTTNTGPISGTVGNNGGAVSRLVFAVVGDTRPADEDETSEYPTAIITKIFQDIQAQSPHPVLVIGTGDYQFSSAGSDGTGAAQVQLYMTARASYTGPYFPAMGNHECGVSGSFTTSDNNDCGPGNPGGVTTNYNAFMNEMMAPISQTNPYYSINVNASDNSWTAKFVVTAANAWDTAQQTWMEGVMAQKTTYTFVVRHEPSDATPPLPTGVAGVDTILGQYPYTLLLTGHSHTYGHYSDAPQTVVIGNGGAPLSSKDYGYGLFSQRCDGAIVADEYDYMTGATDSYFHFVITPAGTITQ
jgi:Calcineurin-like phosphoesterase